MKTQLEIGLPSRGGKRKNAGRKRIHSQGVSHSTRERVTRHTPVHVNFKFNQQVRNTTGIKALSKAISNSRRFISIIHYSLQSNHVHLIIEAENNFLLSKGMRSLTVTFAMLMRKGSIQIERYHLHVLRTPREVRNVVAYVLLNDLKHRGSNNIIADSFSSLHLQDLQNISRLHSITIVKSHIKFEVELDPPNTWLLRTHA